ncbi:MAG: thiamine pyrophosphate-dependent dehydrogenase E1 component subunit alpha [Ardenticatenaceae bacterium]|nr:thiamine pyrophosphate-dependent dehydrogenase E1 component subunit alpha [Ardenticatenaceae bacterium]
MTPPDDQLRDWYRQMLTIRLFEEAIFDLYTRGEMPGLAHLSIGQEAVAVGVMAALEPDDYIVSTHRGHGHCIAKGADLNALTAELLGKVTGLCRGKGGTMHVADMAHNNVGATGIVGGGLGLATGIALALQLRGTHQIAVGFFGDGAGNQGIYSEVLNLASLWKLPVLFVCENNQFGEYTPWERVTASKSLAERAAPYGIPYEIIDGMDVMTVYNTARATVAQIRAGNGPYVIECETYRYTGHHVGDPGGYRTREEIEEWRKRDPLLQFENWLLERGVLTAETRDALVVNVRQRMAEAVAFAKSSPFPDLEELDQHVLV